MGLEYQMLQAALKHLLHRNDLRKGEGRFGSFLPVAYTSPSGVGQTYQQRQGAGQLQDSTLFPGALSFTSES